MRERRTPFGLQSAEAEHLWRRRHLGLVTRRVHTRVGNSIRSSTCLRSDCEDGTDVDEQHSATNA